MSAVRVAVVVIGRNEATRLDRVFASIRALDYPAERIELVYVDSNSNDSSVRVARGWGARVIVLQDPPFNAAKGRQAGWQATSAQFVLFLDGDCEVSPGFLSEALAQFGDPAVAIVWGQLSERNATRSFWQEMLALRFHGLPAGPGPLMGGNHVCRRSALEAVDGFNTQLESGENTDLGRRVRRKGGQVVRLASRMAVHNTRVKGFWSCMVRGFRFGYGDTRFLASVPGEWRQLRQYYDLGPRFTDMILLLGSVFLSVVMAALWSVAGLLAAGGLLLGLVLAKAWRCRQKSPRWATLLAYGFFTQMLAVPIAAGHLVYWLDALRGKGRLIDYWRKQPVPSEKARVDGIADPLGHMVSHLENSLARTRRAGGYPPDGMTF